MDRWGISAFPYPDREELRVAEESNIRGSTLYSLHHKYIWQFFGGGEGFAFVLDMTVKKGWF